MGSFNLTRFLERQIEVCPNCERRIGPGMCCFTYTVWHCYMCGAQLDSRVVSPKSAARCIEEHPDFYIPFYLGPVHPDTCVCGGKGWIEWSKLMHDVKIYKRKPLTVEAVYLDEDSHSFDAAQDWILDNGGSCSIDYDDDQGGYILNVRTLEGNMTAQRGTYIVRGVKGEFYPCRGDIFEEIHENID